MQIISSSLAPLSAAIALAACLAQPASPGDDGDDAEPVDTDGAEEGTPDTALRDIWTPTPPNNRSACEAAGWQWYHDVATHYCPGPPSDLSDCPAPVHRCFCVRSCEEDADCAGTALPRCSAVLVFNGGDAAYCSPTVKACVAGPTEPPWMPCPTPPLGRCE